MDRTSSASRTVGLVDLAAQYRSIKPEIDAAVARVLESGSYVTGKEVEAFEQEFAALCNADYCAGVSSGTDAIYLALRAHDVVYPDSPVRTYVPSFTFIATASAVLAAGRKLVLCDVYQGSAMLKLGERDPRGGIALPVGIFGQRTGIRYTHVRTIADYAQAHGAPLADNICAAYSFYPTKNLGAIGQAGAVVSDDAEIIQIVKQLRNHGERESIRFEHTFLSGNHRMDELQAAILRAKLPRLKSWNTRRREIASLYHRGFSLLETQDLVELPHFNESEWHIYPMRVDNRLAFAEHLRKRGIQTSVRYPVPLHKQPALWDRFEVAEGGYPNSEAWATTSIDLPIHEMMSDEDVECVIERVKEFFK